MTGGSVTTGWSFWVRIVVKRMGDVVTGLMEAISEFPPVFGQQTPGSNKLLKHKDCRRFPRLSKS